MIKLNLINLVLIGITIYLTNFFYKKYLIEKFNNEAIGPLVAIYKNNKDNTVKFINIDNITYTYKLDDENFKNLILEKYYMLYKINDSEEIYRVELQEPKKE